MSETTSETTTDNTEDNGGNAGWTPPATKEEFNRIIGERVKRTKEAFSDYDDLKAKASQFDQLADAQKSETQKALERAEAAERAIQEIRTENLRLSVIAKHQIPEELQELIVGSTEEELEARATKVKSLIPAPAETETGIRELFVSGEGRAPALALNGDGLEAALRSKLGI